MKKFRLQSVLEYRRSLEEEAQREFSEIQIALAREMEIGSKIQHQIALWQQKLREKHREGTGPGSGSYPAEIDLYQRFLYFLATEAERQNQKIRSIESDMNKKRQALLEARLERKVMERLKEKTLALREREMLQEEQKILDEKAASQYHNPLAATEGAVDEEG